MAARNDDVYGHVIRKGDEDWVKKCIEFRVEGIKPVGRPSRTWLESVEANMAELEIEMEIECHEEEVQSYRKLDYRPIIYILNF